MKEISVLLKADDEKTVKVALEAMGKLGPCALTHIDSESVGIFLSCIMNFTHADRDMRVMNFKHADRDMRVCNSTNHILTKIARRLPMKLLSHREWLLDVRENDVDQTMKFRANNLVKLLDKALNREIGSANSSGSPQSATSSCVVWS